MRAAPPVRPHVPLPATLEPFEFEIKAIPKHKIADVASLGGWSLPRVFCCGCHEVTDRPCLTHPPLGPIIIAEGYFRAAMLRPASPPSVASTYLRLAEGVPLPDEAAQLCDGWEVAGCCAVDVWSCPAADSAEEGEDFEDLPSPDQKRLGRLAGALRTLSGRCWRCGVYAAAEQARRPAQPSSALLTLVPLSGEPYSLAQGVQGGFGGLDLCARVLCTKPTGKQGARAPYMLRTARGSAHVRQALHACVHACCCRRAAEAEADSAARRSAGEPPPTARPCAQHSPSCSLRSYFQCADDFMCQMSMCRER